MSRAERLHQTTESLLTSIHGCSVEAGLHYLGELVPRNLKGVRRTRNTYRNDGVTCTLYNCTKFMSILEECDGFSTTTHENYHIYVNTVFGDGPLDSVIMNSLAVEVDGRPSASSWTEYFANSGSSHLECWKYIRSFDTMMYGLPP